MSVSVYFDPIAVVIQVFEALYPDADCTVIFRPIHTLEPGVGYTDFPDSAEPPNVVVGVHEPYAACVEILAHELAHVAVGIEKDHGPEWTAAFDAIHAAYDRRVAELSAGRGGSLVEPDLQAVEIAESFEGAIPDDVWRHGCKVAEAIPDDLSGRRGIGDALDGVDDDVRQEIVSAIAEIVLTTAPDDDEGHADVGDDEVEHLYVGESEGYGDEGWRLSSFGNQDVWIHGTEPEVIYVYHAVYDRWGHAIYPDDIQRVFRQPFKSRDEAMEDVQDELSRVIADGYPIRRPITTQGQP